MSWLERTKTNFESVKTERASLEWRESQVSMKAEGDIIMWVIYIAYTPPKIWRQKVENPISSSFELIEFVKLISILILFMRKCKFPDGRKYYFWFLFNVMIIRYQKKETNSQSNLMCLVTLFGVCLDVGYSYERVSWKFIVYKCWFTLTWRGVQSKSPFGCVYIYT